MISTCAARREYLQDEQAADQARAAADAPDAILHDAVIACSGVECIRGTYVKRHQGTIPEAVFLSH